MVKEFQFGLPKPENKVPRLLNAKLGYTNPKIKIANWFNYQEALPYDYKLDFPENIREAKYKTFEKIRVENADYTSVMKSDYINPTYIINYGVTLPKEDPALYKPRVIMGNESCQHKFVDDGIEEKLRNVQNLKRKLYRSYNFITGKYTDEEYASKEQNYNTEDQYNNEYQNDNNN
ncbi:uncharacterized protein LOC123292005 [Chrysoperla carnea]|uniref:uncharacterized protein LOC123292005 n=1 Tax=Chrysoperla carnea TaxID=189513 RepID=UPI001D080B46|nr:uncharacterized protein LOC123292005 [Chrysoperla carnea]